MKTGAVQRAQPARGYVMHNGEHAKACPYQARINVRGRRISLGYFATEQEAAAARRAGEKLAAALVPSLVAAGAAIGRLEQACGILSRGVQQASQVRRLMPRR